jgi:hypothetical protein
MKIMSLLMSLMVVGQLAQAQEVDDQISYVKYCSGPSAVVNVEVYESGVVGWVYTDMTTGQNEQYMGFISAGDSKDLQVEFYATDLGSDLHVNGAQSSMILSGNSNKKIKLKCD